MTSVWKCGYVRIRQCTGWKGANPGYNSTSNRPLLSLSSAFPFPLQIILKTRTVEQPEEEAQIFVLLNKHVSLHQFTCGQNFATVYCSTHGYQLLLWKCIATPMASAFYNTCFRCLITLHEHNLLHSPITRRGIECYYSIQSLSQNFPTRHRNGMLQVRFNLLTCEHWQVLKKSSVNSC